MFLTEILNPRASGAVAIGPNFFGVSFGRHVIRVALAWYFALAIARGISGADPSFVVSIFEQKFAHGIALSGCFVRLHIVSVALESGEWAIVAAALAGFLLN